MKTNNRYIVISPAKDEAGRIERTIECMLKQTLKPARWIIVDDGSTDETPQILRRYERDTEWISVIRIERDAKRKLGSAEIRAFETGFQTIQREHFDFIVKLDCDLEFDATYFENLIARFLDDPRLGIASGVFLEHENGEWVTINMPSYHASGASKVVRARCYSEIGGFPLFPGWDTADEIKAQARGWKTCNFTEIQFRHLRKEGAASGSLSTNVLHGHVFYVTGGGPFYFAIKLARRLVEQSPLAAGALLWGYLRAWVKGSPKLVNETEARSYRAQLRERLDQGLRKAFVPNRISKEAQEIE